MRDILIWGYLTFFKLFFIIFSTIPLKNKTTFVISFGDNALYIYDEMIKQGFSHKIVFLYKKTCKYDFGNFERAVTIPFETFHPLTEIKSIYHLATSKFIIIDNYYGFLSCIQLKKEVECIQVWHAAGAIKKFGLQDQATFLRSKKDLNRFLHVYKQFDKIVVGSEKMANIFKEAFSVSENQMLKTGVPRTDLFFNVLEMNRIRSKLLNANPFLRNKKVILYAPTFRDGQLDTHKLTLDLRLVYERLGNEYVVLLRLHPAIKNIISYEGTFPGFVFDYSSYVDINELLIITDILISDYSSVPFEFALLNRPMIFFAYDLESYQQNRGLWESYEEMVPGPVAKDTSEVIKWIKSNSVDYQKIREFSLKWNEFSHGSSSQKLVKYLCDKEINKETYYSK
ncbi:CDP-glycerol--glycerophosphate glycerophosphotransferase [Heyndrickxia sporothermodurans]|nr:CDP-glycerol--glycerophosphate glycerophosphotransferase [Heyndrickxia sporothermodurans]